MVSKVATLLGFDRFLEKDCKAEKRGGHESNRAEKAVQEASDLFRFLC